MFNFQMMTGGHVVSFLGVHQGLPGLSFVLVPNFDKNKKCGDKIVSLDNVTNRREGSFSPPKNNLHNEKGRGRTVFIFGFGGFVLLFWCRDPVMNASYFLKILLCHCFKETR